MSAPRYFIAKYVPDLRRVEPRNIGVILWTPLGIDARFVAEKEDRPGDVDGRSVPSFVTSTSAYKQWIEYWRGQLNNSEICSLTDPKRRVSKEACEFLDVLSESSKGNFVLAEGGMLLDPVRDLSDAVQYLFDALVDAGGNDETRDPSLDEILDRLIQRAGLRNQPFFHTNEAVDCWIDNDKEVKETFQFSHAVRNGTIRRLYQRVPFSPKESYLRKTVHDAAWMYEQVLKSEIVGKEDAVTIIYSGREEDTRVNINRAIRVLGTVSRVLDIADEDAALQEFESLPSLLHD